jgi:hypothetical protein
LAAIEVQLAFIPGPPSVGGLAGGSGGLALRYEFLSKETKQANAPERTMNELNVWEYKRLGTPEHVLLKAGIVEVDDSKEQSVMVASPKLAALFHNNSAPALDKIAATMTDLVFADLYDKSGYLDGSTLRIQATAALREAGITETGLAVLYKAIVESAVAIKEELASNLRQRR